MAEIHSKKIKEHKLDTVLSEDIVFSGEVFFTKELMIKGQFEGKIHAKGDLIVGQDAQVTAEIEANSIHVKGKIVGDIEALSQVELMGNAEVIGNITAPKILMETGCYFEGQSLMKKGLE